MNSLTGATIGMTETWHDGNLEFWNPGILKSLIIDWSGNQKRLTKEFHTLHFFWEIFVKTELKTVPQWFDELG